MPALSPRKALKVSTSSTAQWEVEAQAAMQGGAASARAGLKEPVAQGEATGAATEQAEEEEPTPREVVAHESDGARAPSVAEATEVEVEALRTSKAEAMGAEALRALEAVAASVGSPGLLRSRRRRPVWAWWSRRARIQIWGRCKLQYRHWFKARRRRRRAPGKWGSIRSLPTILPGGRGWPMSRRPAPWSSQL